MSALAEQVLCFVAMSILVALFTWIYLRDRGRDFGLWLLGWIAIFVHFAAKMTALSSPRTAPISQWLQTVTMVVAGTFFLLSVSELFRIRKHRAIFIFSIGVASIFYRTGLTIQANFPSVHISSWFYVALLCISTLPAVGQAIYFYGLRSSLHLYTMFTMLLPYSGWVMWQASRGNPDQGMDFYLFGFFSVTALAYYGRFRRFTPGAVFTSLSFLVWGLAFPVESFLLAHHSGPMEQSFIWEVPKYFVAFGMILTLFENQTQVAITAATQYETLFERNMAAVYVTAIDGRILNCNSAFLKMYGFESKEEARACPAESLYVEPSERTAFLEALSSEGQVVNYECRQRRKDGSLFWILERATMVTDASGHQQIEGTAIEITERKQTEIALKQSEERFASIFRESPIPCGILTLDGVFMNVNETFLRTIARTADQVIGKTAWELGLWKSRQQREEFYQRLRAEGSVHNLEVDFNDANGRWHEGLYFGTLVRIGDKQHVFAMMLERTEIRELEAKFLQAQKMEALGRFAGGMAHDFNNLLGVIGSYAELLESKLAHNDSFRRYCGKIIDTTQRASGLTRQLLTFSRKERTKPAPLQPDHALRELAGILPRLIGEDIELVMNLRANGTVLMDKTHFEQVLFNIVINARDAMPNGGQLQIETEDIFQPQSPSSRNGSIAQYVSIRIRDTGIGMDEKTRQRAFEPFYTTKSPGQGTGLGLATVYGIVQQCNGEITIDSKPGRGAVVSLKIPAIGDVETGTANGAGHEIKKGSGTILLVEDEADLRNVTAEFLSSIGYSVICASSGPDALQLVRDAGPIDLVVSDVVMPKMNGREFADNLRSLRPETKLLFVSGYADDVVRLSAQNIPFLQKPFSLKALGAKVSEILGGEQ